MAKKSKISKTKAVRDYLVKHPGAMPVDIAAALSKQGVTITAAYAATIKSSIKMEAKKPDKKVAAKETATKPAAVEVIVPVIIEKPAGRSYFRNGNDRYPFLGVSPPTSIVTR